MDIEQLKKQISEGDQFEYLFFWGHDPKDGDKACFSQWFNSPFYIDGILYPTAEHWMMAGKARLFNDDKMLEKILGTDDPRSVKKFGRAVKNFDRTIWMENARKIVTEGNIAKFSQNDNLKQILLKTGSSVLVEASPYDDVWGIYLEANDELAKSPFTWQGLNLLGFSLMDVRDRLNEANL